MVASIWRRPPIVKGFGHCFYSPMANVNPPTSTSLPARWLPDLKKRLGKCIIFGLNVEQTHEAGSILREVANSWRTFLVGREGFVTGKGAAGLENHRVVWGDMV